MNESLRCMLLTQLEKKWLVPALLVSEIITIDKLPIIEDAPKNLEGILTYRGISIPILSLETLKNQSHIHLAILNRVDTVPDAKYPFFAIVLQTTPRLFKLAPSDVQLIQDNSKENFPYLMEVQVQKENAFIPNMPYLWGLVDALPSRFQLFKK